MEIFDFYGEKITVTSQMQVCRDEKDNFLLNLAKDGRADYLITGDKDLLELAYYKVLNLADFKSIVLTN